MESNLGNLAYYDALFSGLIPCKVTGYDGRHVYFTVTANKGPYKRGEELCSDSYHIVPRKMVHTRDGQYRIRTCYQWINGTSGTYAIDTRGNYG